MGRQSFCRFVAALRKMLFLNKASGALAGLHRTRPGPDPAKMKNISQKRTHCTCITCR